VKQRLLSEDCRPCSPALAFLLVTVAAALVAGPLWAAGANAIEVLRKTALDAKPA